MWQTIVGMFLLLGSLGRLLNEEPYFSSAGTAESAGFNTAGFLMPFIGLWLLVVGIPKLKNYPKEKSIVNQNKQIGITFLTVPIMAIILTIFAFAFFNTLLGETSTNQSSIVLSEVQGLRAQVLTMANFIMGLLGLASVIAFIIGIPLGIYSLNRPKHTEEHFDKRSGQGEHSEIPKEIQHWNWGAFFLSWIWGIYHRVWISLLAFIPIVGFVFNFILAIKGNEWAWRKNKWMSLESFRKSQKKWAWWGTGLIAVSVMLIIVSFLLLPKNYNRTSKTPDIQIVNGEQVKYAINYDANKWIVKKDSQEASMEYSFSHKDGDVYGGVIAERIEAPLDTLKEAAITNAKNSAPDTAIISEEKQTINGKEFLIMKMSGTLQNIPFIYYGYYYSGSIGSIQFVTWTSPNLLNQYESDLTELLNGLQVTQ